MRYKYFTHIFTAAALAGGLALSAAPQADDRGNPDQSYTGQQTTVVQTTKPMLSDHSIRHKLHKEIARDPVMSNRALDIRIMSKNGVVTLKGSVPTTMEKNKIEEKAAALVGSGNVIDQIRVTHPNYLG